MPSSGQPQIVVLLHPLALSGQIWESWRDALSPRWRVEAPNAPGHGDATWFGRPWSIWDAAEEIHEGLVASGIERAHLVGASMGGCIALALACRHPAWSTSLSLIDTTAWYGETAEADWAARAKRALSSREEQLSWQLERWFTSVFARAGGPVVELVSSVFLRTSGQAHAAACRALGSFDAREEAAGLEVPTLVLTGENDGATPPAMGEDLSRRIPGSTFELVPGVRHFSFLEAAAPLQHVIAHLEAAPDRGRHT